MLRMMEISPLIPPKYISHMPTHYRHMEWFC